MVVLDNKEVLLYSTCLEWTDEWAQAEFGTFNLIKTLEVAGELATESGNKEDTDAAEQQEEGAPAAPAAAPAPKATPKPKRVGILGEADGDVLELLGLLAFPFLQNWIPVLH